MHQMNDSELLIEVRESEGPEMPEERASNYGSIVQDTTQTHHLTVESYRNRRRGTSSSKRTPAALNCVVEEDPSIKMRAEVFPNPNETMNLTSGK